MKNVEILTKLRRLIKSLAVIVISLVLGLGSSAFKAAASNDGDIKKSGKDSAQTDKYGFQSLLTSNSFDPIKPYITQLNPRAVAFVQNYIKIHGKELAQIKLWGQPYLDMYDNILGLYGLPKELKYLSVIESDLKSGAVSNAGAVGPWQIMDFEARRMGLKVNNHTDERNSYAKSTHAAAKILKELHAQFSDWLLVIAAYNCGAGRVRQAIRKANTSNFWDMQNFLPLETRNHVKRFIGTHYMFEGNGGLTTMTAAEIKDLRSSLPFDGKQEHNKLVDDENYTKSAEISGKYNAAVIAKNIDMDVLLFNTYNPNFNKLVSSGTVYKLKLPVEKMQLFNERKQVILNESMMLLLGAGK